MLAPASSGLENAEAVRAGLEQKLEAARDALNDIDARRAALAFEAHSNGGAAKTELAKLNKSRVAQELDIENLQSAIIEASRRVTNAEREAELTVNAERAGRALEIGARLLERAKKIDAALAIVVASAAEFKADLRELNFRVGCSHPHEHQFQSLGERALKAAMMNSPFRLEHLAPHERHTFGETLHGMVCGD
jgi:hypothetical protein